MFDDDALWLEEPIDDGTEPLALAHIRQHLAHDHHDEDLGLRALLERTDAPSFEEDEAPTRRRHAPKALKRHAAARRAA